MNYQETLDWIHGQLKFGIRPGLKRVLWVLDKLGNPQEKIFGIHVVGTNGKGSTVNNIQHMLTESGYKVGTFTSPFIMDFRERISINGQMISKEDLVSICDKIKPITEELFLETDLGSITEFEIITVIMFYYFVEINPVDIAIIEAGLGGLYDSTNVFKAFAVVCPSIGLDHQDILGKSYREIASQKAGVIKGGEHVLFAIDQEEARATFIERCQLTQSKIHEFQSDFKLQKQTKGYCFMSGKKLITSIQLAMPGDHQVSNAALAIQTCLLLKEKLPNISDDSIKKGLEKSYWLGRTELMAANLMIDGAHNNESIQALISVLKEKYSSKKLHLLFAAINTKPVDQMLACLSELGDVQVTQFDYPRAVELADYPAKYKRVSNFREWLSQRNNDSEEDFYVITGSLYFISEVRQYLKQKETSVL